MTNFWANLLGYAASAAVLVTFLMRTMIPLRLIAILSNVLFLLFGYLQHIYPVLFLHTALLPINTWRLVMVQRARPSTGAGEAPRPYAFWFAVGLLLGFAGSFAVLVLTSLHPQ